MTITNNPRVDAIRQSVRGSYDEINQLVEDHLTKMDSDLLYQSPAPGEWTLMESLAHIVEFMPYWADEIVKLVAHPGQNFGRTKEDEARIRAIKEHDADSLDQAHIALSDSYGYLDRVLGTLQDSDLELTGHHSKFGEQSLGWFIRDFVTDHLINHIEQMDVCLAALETK